VHAFGVGHLKDGRCEPSSEANEKAVAAERIDAEAEEISAQARQ